ncbi:murein biosynthesis protein MurJ [Corynebacterium qintianiae]|uniref:Murein biosynthesis protein MurJ n=1 Tax=Corynebacterium qintianiae TaxID=2709392 RepID=A0A7T0PFX6_9CORY|nr:murein biosynthesis integral membrane protein MurJ [Corynebacterium qintianiae]QPK83252.1 murein biosynthesis protein MurJ [Corynebacterium qintianiae]
MTQQNPNQQQAGLRRRIVTPAPPAPVPVLRETPPAPVEEERDRDRSALTISPSGEALDIPRAPEPVESAAAGEGTATSNSDVVRSTGSMAVATLLSRITGFIRTVLIGAALGAPVASAFNTANTLPNLITEIVLGSVLTALVVPVLVRAEKEDPDRGAAFIRRLFTLTFTLLVVVTVLAVATAPLLTRMMLDEDGEVNVVQSTAFAYLLLPQIFFYGMFALFMAILNTKEHFRPGAWAPVANNVVSIVVLALYMAVPGVLNPATPASTSNPHVLLLGIGTTLGVVAQCAIMLPALRKLGIDLRPLWGIDARLKSFGGMALAIIAYVAISQVGYIVTTRIASVSDSSAPIIYQQHWMLLQVPYGVIGVTLLTAIMPRLSRNAADGDDRAVVRDLTLATKLTFIALIPIIVFMTALGPDIGHGLFAYGNFDVEHARILGLAISFSAFTLIPYALVMLHLRVFYAREEAWTPTFIIAGITAAKVVLSMIAPLVAVDTSMVVILLAAANGFGFIAGAVIGAFLLRRKLGTLETVSVLRTSAWALGSAVAGIAAVLAVKLLLKNGLGLDVPLLLSTGLGLAGFASIGYIIEIALQGLLFLIITGLVLSRSGLPEVQNLGRALTRVPGLGRFIRPDEDKALEVGEVDPRDVSTQFLAADSFNASPVPPPMSAGVVRGPRLVPGAAVSDGRFRLIRDHGSSQSTRFWQARELSTGKTVALTFVDTSGTAPMAPPTPREAAINAAGVVRRTRKLAGLAHPAVADNIQILSYRSGALVVADWVPGSSVKAVAEAGRTLHTEAVAHALAPLASALGAAHEAGVPLGLDNRNRLRVSSDGVVRLAFPAVLPDASPEDDAGALAAALELLSADVSSSGLEEVTAEARALADAPTTGPDDFRALAGTLEKLSRANAADGDSDTGTERGTGDDGYGEDLFHEPTVEPAPEPHVEPAELSGGFGRRDYRPISLLFILLLAISAVMLIAALTAYLVRTLGGDTPNAPIAQPTTTARTTATAEPTGVEVVIGNLNASLWGGATAAPAQLAFDGDTTTTWSGTPGSGLTATTNPGVSFLLNQVIVTAPTTGADYQVYGIPESAAGEQELSDLPELASGKFQLGQNSIDVDHDGRLRGVVVYFPNKAGAPADGPVELREIALIGKTFF